MSDQTSPASPASPATGAEVVLAGSEIAIPGDTGLAAELAAERTVWRAVRRDVILATPLTVVVYAAIVLAAVGGKSPEHLAAWIGIGVIVGVLGGAFFGGWAAFLRKAHVLEAADAAARH